MTIIIKKLLTDIEQKKCASLMLNFYDNFSIFLKKIGEKDFTSDGIIWMFVKYLQDKHFYKGHIEYYYDYYSTPPTLDEIKENITPICGEELSKKVIDYIESIEV